MAYDKYKDMMNRSIDGLLSDEEQPGFDQFLRDHPEAQGQFEELKKVSRALGRIPQADPPPEIKQNIMDAVKSSPAVAQERKTVLASLIEKFGSRKVRSHALNFAAGLTCGILIMAISINYDESSNQVDPSRAAGALIDSEIISDSELLGNTSFTVGRASGTIAYRTSGKNYLLEIDNIADQAVMVDISYDSEEIMFAGLWAGDSFDADFHITDNQLSLAQPGSGKFTVIFLNKSSLGSHFTCRIQSGGESFSESFSTQDTIRSKK